MIFRSAVDSWYYLMIIASALIIFFASIPLITTGNVFGMTMIIITALIAIGLPVWLLLSTKYIVTPQQLIIESGPFHWHIPRNEIHSIIPTRSLLSSPALSLDRLKITYGTNRSILVSPADKKSFIEALGKD